MCCIELRGTEQKILDGLGHLTNPQTGWYLTCTILLMFV